MEILFATHNPSKLKLYKDILGSTGFSVIGLDDININEDVIENFLDTKENAIKKAREYSKMSNMITIADDTGLFFEDVPQEVQPGSKVRRVNGKTLNDEEMLEYYIDLVEKYGKIDEKYKKIDGFWSKSIAIYFNENEIYCHNYKVKKIFIDKIAEKRNIGFPLDSISLTPKYNKYTVDLTETERLELLQEDNKEVFEFLNDTLKRLK